MPTEDDARAIKDFCLEDGRPYMYRGHTHTAPPTDGKPPIYIDRIEISADARKRKEFSPCPCCTPNHRKFGAGLIAWFEDERVIRLIGEDCFASINRAGHEEAYFDLVKRENERKQLDHLLSTISKMARWVDVGAELLPIAKKADEFLPQVANRIVVSQGVSNFWREIRGGVLNLNETVLKNLAKMDGPNENLEDDDGERSRDDIMTIRVGSTSIEGHNAMNPARKDICPLMTDALLALQASSHLTPDGVKSLPPTERLKIARELRRVLEILRRERTKLHHQVRFLGQVNINRIGQWASDPRSPIYHHGFSISRRGSTLTIGGSRRDPYVFDIPEELRVMTLPDFDAPV